MKVPVRFALPLLVVLGVMAAVFTPIADELVGRWFRHDVEMRSRLVFSSVEDSLTDLVGAGSQKEIETLFDRIAGDERVLAVAWCSGGGQLQETSKSWPETLSCPGDLAVGKPLMRTEALARGAVLVAAFPIGSAETVQGHLVILHDLGFIERRSLTARLAIMAFLTVLGVVAAALTVLMAHLTLRGWLDSLRNSLMGGPALPAAKDDAQIGPVIGEIRQLLRDLDISRRTAAGIRVDWAPDTLRRVLDNELPGAQVIVVSNREPYIHNHGKDGGIVVQRPASGLVTALEPIMRACGGTWVAHGSGSADRETVDKADRVAVPPEEPTYSLRRVWLSDEEQEGYYYGLANEGLWPLCHITFVRPVFREPDWEYYVSVNRKFAEAIVKEATRPDPIVLVQDYHFALLPRMVREKLPEAIIITFWHIPWPNSEVFGICPWRAEVLDGLLGSSIVGFHTQLHCNNFIESADRFLECHIDREHSGVSVGGRLTLVRPYPISIAWPPAGLANLPPAPECRARVFARLDLPPGTKLGVGVERFDFTKGIPDRFRAVGILLEKHPEWIGRFVFLQVAAPTRSKLPAYRAIQEEAEAVANEINARFGNDDYQPIILAARHHEPEEVYELFRAADVCMVSSLHDGMNLVAKEFVAAREDERGVLILSTFAGASRELMEALIVNPFDAKASADAVFAALGMSPEQQAERMHLMRELVSENNVYYWAGRMLLDASRMRKRCRIENGIAAASGQGRRNG
jgi:trehalose 6-phosphate synthase